MYIRGKIKGKVLKPFEVKCTNCGSHDVNVVAAEWQDLFIVCENCNSSLQCGGYNETRYEMVGESK